MDVEWINVKVGICLLEVGKGVGKSNLFLFILSFYFCSLGIKG